MSLSFIENKDVRNLPYIKLEIYQSQICENMNVPLPYGLLISFNNNSFKYIETINSEKEIIKPPKNTFIYNLDNNSLNNQNIEFIITSFTTSMFIIKKNFASVIIPFQLDNTNSTKEKKWYFLKDINNNKCIKLLISIEINITREKNKTNVIKYNNILYKNNRTINENRIKNISRSNTNHIINSHNTYLISTNYNSSRGNSLLNLTNNKYNINSNHNLNISFPINLSPITLIGKSNSFFIDSKNNQMENNMKIINNNLNYNNSLKSKKEQNSIKSEEDSIIINDNDFELDEENNKDKKNSNSLLFQTQEYKQEIQNELNNYEKSYILTLNNIYNINNNLEQILIAKNYIKKESNQNLEIITPRKAESYNKINLYERIKNKTKKGILCLNKTIPHNQMFIKKLNLPKKNGKINNYINSGRKLQNKKYTPINYKYKQFNKKLSTSASNISNTENINNDEKNKILRTEGKVNTNTKRINHEKNTTTKFKKIDKNSLKRKSLKINTTLQITNNEISSRKIAERSSNNYQSKYSFVKRYLNKEDKTAKKNLTMTNTIINNKKNSNKNVNKSIIMKSKTIESNINLTDTNNENYFHKNSNISLDKNIFAFENISPNNNRIGKTALNKINNFGKQKLKPQNKTKLINNKSLNIDNLGFNSHNYFKGNPLFIKSNNNKKTLTIKNNTFTLNTNPNESNKKKNIKFRNYLNLSGNVLLLNVQKPNKSTRENKRKSSSSRKILLNELFK